MNTDSMNGLKLMSDAELVIVMRAKRKAGYSEAIDDALRVFAEFEPYMKLNLDMRNDMIDRLGNLKAQYGEVSVTGVFSSSQNEG